MFFRIITFSLCVMFGVDLVAGLKTTVAQAKKVKQKKEKREKQAERLEYVKENFPRVKSPKKDNNGQEVIPMPIDEILNPHKQPDVKPEDQPKAERRNDKVVETPVIQAPIVPVVLNLLTPELKPTVKLPEPLVPPASVVAEQTEQFEESRTFLTWKAITTIGIISTVLLGFVWKYFNKNSKVKKKEIEDKN